VKPRELCLARKEYSRKKINGAEVGQQAASSAIDRGYRQLSNSSEAAEPQECGGLVPNTKVGRPPELESDKVLPAISLSGIVDAIQEVGLQRKVLLDQLRSALESGNDAEALRIARKYCGLMGGQK